MHDLENKNIPVMGIMIQPMSLSIALDPAQQLTVSEWAAKTAMVLDSVDTQTRPLFYDQSERDAMRLKLSLPVDTTIWLGRCSVEGLAAHGTDFEILGTDKIIKIADSCSSTLVVGHLVIQVLTIHKLPTHSNAAFNISPKVGNWDNLLVRVYPMNPLSVAWPPPQSFNPAAINNLLADRWRIGRPH